MRHYADALRAAHADLLSDEYGWCVSSCEYEPMHPDPMSLAKAEREDRLTEGA